MKTNLFTLMFVAVVCTSVSASNYRPHGFSINSDGDMITFAPGNLQYNAATNKWRFAPEQYDIIGLANENISSNYNGWIDLFGWGTSGYNQCYPWLISSSANYGLNGIIGRGEGTEYCWGQHNQIGEDAKGTWYTPSSGDESKDMGYILAYRPNASHLCGFATVAGCKGLILLPDDWEKPAGITFLDRNTTGYTANTYSSVQWQKMEANGAVFLPAAGARVGTQPTDVQSSGYYWCNGQFLGSGAKAFFFTATEADVTVTDGYDRYYGFAVRLVRPYVTEVNYTPTGLVSIQKEDGTAIMYFGWNAVNGVPKYEVVVKQGATVLYTGITTQNTFGVDFGSVAQGTYQMEWGVRSLDANGNPISEWVYDVATMIVTQTQGVDDVHKGKMPVVKVLRDNQIIILCGDKTYTIEGQETR